MNGLWVRDRVPGVHDEIRGQRVQGPDPRQQPVPPGGQVDIGQVKQPHRFRSRGEDRNVGPAQGEPVPLQDAGVAECRTAGNGGEGEGTQGCSHPPMVPWWSAWWRQPGWLVAPEPGCRRRCCRRGKMDAMAALKDRLRSDLTTAMKARDEVTVRTLRMALTSVTKEEVA